MKRSAMKPGTKPMKRSPMNRSVKLPGTMPSFSGEKPEVVRTRMKSKQRAVTPAEKEIWSKLAALGCIACAKDGRFEQRVSIHHVDGRTKPGCHMLVLPLCAGHHQDGTGEDKLLVAVHPWKARFEKRYGNQENLVKFCMSLIGE